MQSERRPETPPWSGMFSSAMQVKTRTILFVLSLITCSSRGFAFGSMNSRQPAAIDRPGTRQVSVWHRRSQPQLSTKRLASKRTRRARGARNHGVKVLLPVWHKISVVEVREHSPMLADRVAASSGKGIDHVASQLLQAIRKADAGSGIVEASAPIAGTAPPLLVMPTALTSVPRAELRCSFNMHDPGCVRRNTLCAEMFAVPGQATPVVRQSKCDWYRVKVEAIGSGELLSGENPPLPFTHGAADGTTTIHEGVPEHLDLLAVFEDNRVMLAVLPKQSDHPSMTATLRLRVLANQSENGR
jgi:hypothetical protein